jgi:hypothetical protein
MSMRTKSEIYDSFEPKLNAGEVELLDDGKLQEQLLTLVIRGSKIDHLPGDHDDSANAACGAIVLASAPQLQVIITPPQYFGQRSSFSNFDSGGMSADWSNQTRFS